MPAADPPSLRANPGAVVAPDAVTPGAAAPDAARAAAKAAAQAGIDAATAALARGELADAEWQRRVSAALSASYRAEDDPRWQSGYDGDAARWRAARELVLDALPDRVPAGATLLDVGCANGHLVECLAAWARERGLALEPHGLELDPALADLARRRLPEWADRVHTGNASDWAPPVRGARYTYVRTGLEYAPPGRGAALVARLLRDLVAPGGRLIVGPVHGADVPGTVAAYAEAGVPAPGVAARTDRWGKTRAVVWAHAGSERRSVRRSPAA